LLNQPEQLAQFNPFRPAMRANAARTIPDLLRGEKSSHYGAVLRPCEIRTLNQLEMIAPFPRERLITMCVDCLGTFPADDIQWRAERKGSVDGLAQDTLKFARQGGISVDRYRPACQVCRSPSAERADVNIWVIGLPARQYIMINICRDDLSEQFEMADFPFVKADIDLLEMRQRVLGRVIMRNQHSRERFVQELSDYLPANIDAIAEHLENCGECRKCLDTCPICAAQDFKRGADGRYSRRDIAQWLAACAGCGMCEQVCAKNIPLSAVFGVVHEQVEAIS
jgi:Pyruvate/2-oxoacid:ferredoxin oxidoreductase delta subunit